VFLYVLRRVPQREEAEDITAQVFAAAFAGLPQFRGRCSPYLWLLGIARRQIAAALRRQAVRRETLVSELPPHAVPGAVSAGEPLWTSPADADSPEAALMRAEARLVLGSLVAQLTAEQREALMLQYVEQLCVAEIAVVMERTPQSVYSLLKRARAMLYKRGRSYFLEAEVESDE
jgi:RNA polymerase sigma-70 factor (ECF subfamily)